MPTSEGRQPGRRIEHLTTGIPGFDDIACGGLPAGRTTLVAGTSGSGKTIFAIQYLVRGILDFDQGGVMVTFEETPVDLADNVLNLGWDLDRLVEDGRLAFVDGTQTPGEEPIETGRFDFSALLARIEHAARKVGATRAVLDSVGALFPQFADANNVRRELRRIGAGLRRIGLTSLITVERTQEYGPIARFGVEEFVADNVIVLRNPLEMESRRRTIEILKIRGAPHQKGEYPFTIDATSGLTALPISSIELEQRSSRARISSGNARLDQMCGGGMYRDSIILASGATGTGKTLLTSIFIKAAISQGERALLFAFEESREQLYRNATSWGIDFDGAEAAGQLKVICRYPETMGLEDHLIHIKREIEAFGPDRIAVDSLSALERVSTVKSFREFVIGVTSHIKHQETAGLFTNTTSMLLGGESITDTHISTITDSIILLRYVELYGQMRRGITVLKMRGSWHDKDIREYEISSEGMQIGETFTGVSGILSGTLTYGVGGEKGRLSDMFDEGA